MQQQGLATETMASLANLLGDAVTYRLCSCTRMTSGYGCASCYRGAAGSWMCEGVGWIKRRHH